MTNSREGVLGNHLTAPTYFRQRGAVPSENDAEMELHRLHAQLHDRLPRPLRGVDRVHVGLHVRRRARLRALLFGHRFGGKSGHPQSLLGFVAQQLLRHGR